MLRRKHLSLTKVFVVVAILVVTTLAVVSAVAQQQTPATPQQPPSTQAPPEAGGPQGDVGPIIVPKKKDQPPPEKPKPPVNPPGMPQYSITKNVPLVNLDVAVVTKDGQFIPGLKRDNFRILEDGVPQKISNFSQGEAPITAVLLVEFANNNYYFMVDNLRYSYYFADSLRKDDWVAVISYDMKPYIIQDFTQDKRAVFGALNTLRIPGFSETNLFDALYDTIDRLEGVEGRKYIILVSTGRDTFSKLNYDQILKKIKSTNNITIYPIGTGRAYREWLDARYGGNPEFSMWNLDYLQAENEMNTFAKMTGGRAYFPRFEGELSEIYRDIGNSIRNEYQIAYHPTNEKQDGTYRKLKVEVIAPDGGPLTVKDQKGKTLKYQVVAREGYTAKHEVE